MMRAGLALVPREGLEPSRPYGHTPLKRARLPVPPPRLAKGILQVNSAPVKMFSRNALVAIQAQLRDNDAHEISEFAPARMVHCGRHQRDCGSGAIRPLDEHRGSTSCPGDPEFSRCRQRPTVF